MVSQNFPFTGHFCPDDFSLIILFPYNLSLGVSLHIQIILLSVTVKCSYFKQSVLANKISLLDG